MSSMCNRVFVVVNGPHFSYIIDVIFLTDIYKGLLYSGGNCNYADLHLNTVSGWLLVL